MNMLFDFHSFVEELKENQEKKEVISKFEKYFGPITGDIYEQNWYLDYISKFQVKEYLVPQELEPDFDWDLLIRLVAGSFSSDGLLDYKFKEGTDGEKDLESLPEFIISVQSGDQVVVKKISELWGFQILRLYEIYIEEQLNLQILTAEDEKEKEAIEGQRVSRLNRWTLVLENLEKEKLKEIESKEKDEKLTNLLDQL
ncbi:MAG: hypothetical protein V3575_05175 [Candidatus Absconditabacteria bacterium]